MAERRCLKGDVSGVSWLLELIPIATVSLSQWILASQRYVKITERAFPETAKLRFPAPAGATSQGSSAKCMVSFVCFIAL